MELSSNMKITVNKYLVDPTTKSSTVMQVWQNITQAYYFLICIDNFIQFFQMEY